jgi:hypothetical protein
VTFPTNYSHTALLQTIKISETKKLPSLVFNYNFYRRTFSLQINEKEDERDTQAYTIVVNYSVSDFNQRCMMIRCKIFLKGGNI